MGVALEFGEVDLAEHDCGRPWTVYSRHAGVALGMRWGLPAFEAFSTARQAGWIHSALRVCLDCDHAEIWAPGGAGNKRLRRLFRDLDAHIEAVARDELHP